MVVYTLYDFYKLNFNAEQTEKQILFVDSFELRKKQKQTHLFQSRYDLQQYLSYCGNISTNA